MTRVYTTRFRVRHYELGPTGHVHHDVYQQYLHQLSFEASADAGYGVKRYSELGTIWYIRTIVVEYGRPAVYDDVLEARTWVSDFRKFRSHREYVLTHVPSGDVVLRGRADWVYLDVQTLWPKRLSPDILTQFEPNGQTAVEPVSRADEPDIYPEAALTTIPWSVRWRDADEAGHVNNATYTNWFEEVIRHALGNIFPGPAPDRGRVVPLSLAGQEDREADHFPITRHEIEYLRPAQPGDELTVTARPRSRVGDRLTWLAEVVRPGPEGDEVMTRDYVDTEGPDLDLP
jgi:YbgC/YbaW family acyl-CoA thioester hydrolase